MGRANEELEGEGALVGGLFPFPELLGAKNTAVDPGEITVLQHYAFRVVVFAYGASVILPSVDPFSRGRVGRRRRPGSLSQSPPLWAVVISFPVQKGGGFLRRSGPAATRTPRAFELPAPCGGRSVSQYPCSPA